MRIIAETVPPSLAGNGAGIYGTVAIGGTTARLSNVGLAFCALRDFRELASGCWRPGAGDRVLGRGFWGPASGEWLPCAAPRFPIIWSLRSPLRRSAA
jgi:hypothetical protein